MMKSIGLKKSLQLIKIAALCGLTSFPYATTSATQLAACGSGAPTTCSSLMTEAKCTGRFEINNAWYLDWPKDETTCISMSGTWYQTNDCGTGGHSESSCAQKPACKDAIRRVTCAWNGQSCAMSGTICGVAANKAIDQILDNVNTIQRNTNK